jgi:hypothetical protein
MARTIEQGDWIDLRVEVTRKDKRTITVWLPTAGQHVTMRPDAGEIIGVDFGRRGGREKAP